MIGETLEKLEGRIRTLSRVSDAKKDELAALFRKLKDEITALPDAQAEQAESIGRFAELSAHEAAREEGSPQLQKISLDGLSASVEGFEASHPTLVESVNQICASLSGLGI